LTSSDNIDVFFTNPNQIDLFVPDGTVAAYEAAAGWTGLKSYSISIVDDNALHFDGAEESYDNYVSIPSFSIDDEFTIEVWVKTTVDDEGMTIFYVGPNSGLGSVFGVNGTILYTEQDTRGGSGITNIADGNWHHVAVSRNTNTENNIKLYVDGIIESTFTKPSFDSYTTGYLGMLPVGGLIWEFDGSMDELRIWDYAKTQSQIQAQMLTKLTGTEDNLLAFYPFNQGNADEANPSETTLFDYSGNNNHGELQNFTLDGTTSNWVDGLDFTTLPEDAFVTEWDVEAGESITIPINDDYNYDFTVDWGDGSTSDIVTSNDDDDALTHDYINAGTYTVSITGDFPAIYFNDPFGNNATNSEKIQTVQQWGYTQWLSMWNAFAGCTNLDVYATDAPNLTVVTEMWGMFRNASSFTGQNTDLNSWDVSNVEKFSTLFTNSQFNADISNWNLQNADVSGGDFSDIFTNTSLDCSNYSAILIGWGENDNTASGNFILSGNDFYTASAATAVSNLVTNKGWIINGTEVTECPSLSINDEVFSNAISVSPNPVTSLLTINGPADFELKQATVYTIMGKQLLRTTNTTLNTSTLPSGLYILKIENTEGLIATKKIIKQ
ncbi:MAG: LamG-like jellyroll fold domain-containing protein, partial [Algibacter sp.]